VVVILISGRGSNMLALLDAGVPVSAVIANRADAAGLEIAAGGLDEFLLERYTAFTKRGNADRLFRVWHQPWPQAPIDVTMLDESLVASTGPWFHDTRRIGAHYSPGFETVWMGRPRRRAGW